MWGDFIIASKVAGILVAIIITLLVFACLVVGGRSDKD